MDDWRINFILFLFVGTFLTSCLELDHDFLVLFSVKWSNPDALHWFGGRGHNNLLHLQGRGSLHFVDYRWLVKKSKTKKMSEQSCFRAWRGDFSQKNSDLCERSKAGTVGGFSQWFTSAFLYSVFSENTREAKKKIPHSCSLCSPAILFLRRRRPCVWADQPSALTLL